MIGPLMLDIAGIELSEDDKLLLENPLVGGVIFFTRNYESPEQVTALCESIRAINPDLLLAVDHEGGRVQRFKPDFTLIPPMAELGKLYEKDPAAACTLAESCAWVLAMELLAVGIDFSFTPVLDLDLGVSDIIGNRSFHRDPHIVSDLAQLFIHSLWQAGMPSVGKHFPGHGSVAPDSHLDLPIDDRSLETIAENDLIPFQKLAQAGLSAIMPAHILFSQVDDKPVGFSKRWLQTILRNQLGFEGVIFSDDLTMEGAKVLGDITMRADLALAAGCDMVLVCNHRPSVIELLEAWQSKPIDSHASERLVKMRGMRKYTWEILHENPNYQVAVDRIRALTKERQKTE